MLFGNPPFSNTNHSILFQQIKTSEIRFSSDVQIGGDCKDFLKRVLAKDPDDRLGNKNDGEELKLHPWFRNMDWEALLNKKVK